MLPDTDTTPDSTKIDFRHFCNAFYKKNLNNVLKQKFSWQTFNWSTFGSNNSDKLPKIVFSLSLSIYLFLSTPQPNRRS